MENYSDPINSPHIFTLQSIAFYCHEKKGFSKLPNNTTLLYFYRDIILAQAIEMIQKAIAWQFVKAFLRMPLRKGVATCAYIILPQNIAYI